MDKYAILIGYFEKQLLLIDRLYEEITGVDLTVYEKRYLFAFKTQQFYTAIENLFKQIAKAFENHIDDLSSYHKAILVRMETEIPNLRPAVISRNSLILLDKVGAFRYFIRHAYDCELDERELFTIQARLQSEFSSVKRDLASFKDYLSTLV